MVIVFLSQGNTDQTDEGVFWLPIYGIDRELEKLFHDVGGHTSQLACIDGYTNLIIDDEKLRMRHQKQIIVLYCITKVLSLLGLLGTV